MLSGDISGFMNLIKSNSSFLGLVLSIFGLALGEVISLPNPLVLGLGLTLFSAWDSIGYESVARSDNRENMIRYRICQTSVQLIIIILLGGITHWNTWVVLGFIYLWWMGVCDVLFYALLNRLQVMVAYGNMSWLWWTPLGIMNRLMGRETSGVSAYYIAVYAVIMWYSIWWLYPSIRVYSLFQ